MSGKPAAPARAPTVYRGHFGDNLSRCAIVSILVAFFGLFGISIIVGVTGPKATQLILNERPYLFCLGQAGCVGSYQVTFADMKRYNQFLLTTITPERPLLISGQPALMSSAISLPGWTYQLDVKGVSASNVVTTIVQNTTHSLDVYCPANSASCGTFVLFFLPSIDYDSYIVSMRFIDPLGPFSAVGPQLQGGANVLVQSYITSSSYSTFQMGFRYFFFTLQLIVWLVFTIFLCRGRKDANGNKLSWSPEQKLVWWLSFLAIFFNDPAYAALALDNPPFGAAFLNGVFTVTFLTYLLVFFAIHFHLAALQGEWALGLSLTQSASAAVNRRAALGVPVSPNAAITGLNHPSLGMCFWLPKIMFATAFWIVSLTAFLYLRYKQLEDPAFGLWETVPAGFGTYVLIFLYLLATVYLLYVLVYAVIACRHYKRLRPSAKVFLFTTLTTLLLVVIGIYLDTFSPLRTTSASYLVVYAVASLYTVLLVFLYLPDNRSGAVSLGQQLDLESGVNGEPVSSGVMTLGGDDEDHEGDVQAAIADIDVSKTRKTAQKGNSGSAAVVQGEGELPGAVSQDANAGVFVVDEEEEEEGSSPANRRA